MGVEPIQVRMPSIVRAWKSSGGTEVWLLLKGSDTTFDQFVDALDEANARWGMRSPEIGSFPSGSPVGLIVCVLDVTGRAALAEWIDTLREALELRGVSGTITAAPQAHPPVWMNASNSPALTTFVAWTVDLDSMTTDPERTAHWHVPPAATDAIAGLVSNWAIEPNSEVILRQNIFCLKVNTDDVAGPLSQSIQATGMAGVDVVQAHLRRCRHASLSPGGDTVFQVVDGSLDWEQQLQQLRPTLGRLPEHTNHAFIRPAQRGALSITDVDRPVPLPGIREYHVRYSKHLLGEYVPDAHGVQVLRDAHLRRAADLSRWNVSDLGYGRFMVEAPDLEPWYADTLPDPHVLSQARKDFGSMLLTEEVTRNHPAPWL